MTMRFCRRALALAIALVAMPACASEELPRPEPDTIIFAMMSGKCRTFKVGGRDLPCRAVAFSQTEEGRANFTIAINDPKDDSHIITFSGDNGRRPAANVYELPIDRMLLKSKDRPKVDGLPVPSIALAAGLCRQVGNFVTLELSSISCTAVDQNGKNYELQYQSDGTPMAVRRIKRMRVGSPAVSPYDDMK
ncbi:hypothetical protein [Bradyrhizobium roseum]|uniref:hypothetical protein n=1 Tax=Bradyrhizobium roseum TaxID=3056648 RepID=UPI00262EF107|nr:hypothetical protein [Bradyrhizobium roseus]WKA29127.1 hypothetical protein QUH67_02705 [Bradyrhizobium roseus]